MRSSFLFSRAWAISFRPVRNAPQVGPGNHEIEFYPKTGRSVVFACRTSRRVFQFVVLSCCFLYVSSFVCGVAYL
jgi:hypothetical protein